MKVQLYHKYVFNLNKRKFVGKFEKMYIDEDKKGYDSWFQEDMTHIGRQLSLLILNRYSFNSILDIGCGKGTFTHLLKKVNNEIMGIDMSYTAIKKAKLKYPDIKFLNKSVENVLSGKKSWDLIVIMEVLSYIKEWKKIIKVTAGKTKYLYLSLYLPDNPIGYVKSFKELIVEFEKYFKIKEKFFWNDNTIYCLLKSKLKRIDSRQ